MGPARHRLDVYDAELFLATDSRQWSSLKRKLSFLQESGKPDSAGRCDFAVWAPNAGINTPHLVFWVDVAAHTDGELVNTCAHEAQHAVAQLMDHIGHSAQPLDESAAYLTGWITQWLWEACIERRTAK